MNFLARLFYVFRPSLPHPPPPAVVSDPTLATAVRLDKETREVDKMVAERVEEFNKDQERRRRDLEARLHVLTRRRDN